MKTSSRNGVSTGSLVDEKCQRFAVPATQGWKIDPNTVQIVSRISQGSSRASIVDISSTQVVVVYCARSTIVGLSKKTGDSFGSVRFTEKKQEKLQRTEIVNAKSDSGKIRLPFPDNVVQWHGELLEVGENESTIYSSDTVGANGRFQGFDIKALTGSEITIEKLKEF